MVSIFIDGQAGTTGLEITGRLSSREDLQLMQISDDERKDQHARQACLQAADIAILCLPDDAAREAVKLAEGKTRILDASTAYRTDPQWTYGLPELEPGQRSEIANAQFVSNPGCYPQGFILLTRPLIEAGLLDREVALRCHAVSGYSGGGRQMVERFQNFSPKEADTFNSQTYGLTLSHKHAPEMWTYSTMVANYYKGMLVHVPLFSKQELQGAGIDALYEVLTQRYADEPFIEVMPPDSTAMLNDGFLNPTALNDTNHMQLMLFGNPEQIMLVARYDNLGKGASGAAVQNLNIMLGIDEKTGL